jgi:hypothetical protein
MDGFEREKRMSYVTRDQAGNINGLYSVQQFDGQEFVEGATLPVLVKAIPAREFRLALTRAGKGLRAGVEAYVSQGSQDLKDWYEFSLSFERNHPLVIQAGVDLGKSPADLDALWSLGASL